MSPQNAALTAQDEEAVRALYAQMHAGWNGRDGAAMAAVFADEGEVIGFDGSEMHGRQEIAASLTAIFADHITAPYVSKVRSVRLLAPGLVLLRAVVGMVPPGQSDLNPAVNAHQTVIATQRAGTWQILLLQNTPAQFHGRPDLAAQLTEELRVLL